MKLHKLIEVLKTSNTTGQLVLPNYEDVLDKLEELNSMIGMENVKETFVSQILLILQLRKDGHNLPFKKMHTVLSGPPGVGKTSMSILVAQIWTLLGILDKNITFSKKEEFRLSRKDIIEYKKNIGLTSEEIHDLLCDIHLELTCKYEECEDIPDYIKDVYKKLERSMDLTEVVKSTYNDYLQPEEQIKKKNKDLSYVLVGRGDFVAPHVGETSIKTEKLLKKHKGKVIIIEEAYLLYTSPQDSFGMEALTIINRYMDEHCDDYIFIFNGYSDKLESTIFHAQPGLKRRIQWTFNIDSYKPLELFNIFENQLKKYQNPKWCLDEKDRDKIIRFFNKNFTQFPYFGGDTEKLILQIQLLFGESFFDRIDCEKKHTYVIDFEKIERAFKIFIRDNNYKKDEIPYHMYGIS